MGLAVSCCLPAGAQSVLAVTSTLSLAQALQAAQNNLDVSLARRAFEAARGDVTAADRAPTPVLTSKAASINLQNGIGGGNLLRDKRIEKAIGVDWTYERGNKRELRTQAAKSRRPFRYRRTGLFFKTCPLTRFIRSLKPEPTCVLPCNG